MPNSDIQYRMYQSVGIYIKGKYVKHEYVLVYTYL